MNILISAASGLIGQSLIPFLNQKGINVYKLVRKPPSQKNEILWDPSSEGNILPADIEFDAVIHLSGENISKGRWTKSKKDRIVKSRVESTKNLVNAVVNLKHKPSVFICASAIGFYGSKGDKIITESDPPGNDFISKLTVNWEEASKPLINSNIRVVNMRIGVVMTDKGGALSKLILPFKFGFGAIIGTGNQYMSWIDMEDLIEGIYYSLKNEKLQGPVNFSSPNPCTNRDFSKILGGVLKRPVLFRIPSLIIKILFGQMGNELLLASTNVQPKKLTESGYSFKYPQLEDSLVRNLKKSV